VRRRQKARPGELRFTYGRLDGDGPDGIFAWGEGASKRDGALLQCYFNPSRPATGTTSLLKDLEARGYDLSTLVFSVMKKPTSPTDESS
jgi:hypothetical protein